MAWLDELIRPHVAYPGTGTDRSDSRAEVENHPGNVLIQWGAVVERGFSAFSGLSPLQYVITRGLPGLSETLRFLNRRGLAHSVR